jgi:phage shock protein E
MFNIIKKILGLGSKADFAALKQQGAIILDVRTPAEFKSGHIQGALNIPVDQVKANLKKIRGYEKPVITCCRSGARSGMAADILKNAGIEAWNGGPWQVLRSKLG